MVALWLSNRSFRYNLICLPWTYLTRRVKFPIKKKACQVYRVGVVVGVGVGVG